MLNEANYESLWFDKESAGVELDLAPGRIDNRRLGSLRLFEIAPHIWILEGRKSDTKKQKGNCIHDCFAVHIGFPDEHHCSFRHIFAFRHE
jgi:hypothetical protein